MAGLVKPGIERYRVTRGPMSSNAGDQWGFFFIPYRIGQQPLAVMCAPFDGTQRWEHVSVSRPDRCPTWEEMCFIKALFWDDEDCVIQFHPPKSDYVNNHPYCLHLWRNTSGQELPPREAVGI